MIIASETLRNWVGGQTSREEFCRKSGISVGSYYNIIKGKEIGSETVAKLLKVSNMDFEKAFRVIQ